MPTPLSEHKLYKWFYGKSRKSRILQHKTKSLELVNTGGFGVGFRKDEKESFACTGESLGIVLVQLGEPIENFKKRK